MHLGNIRITKLSRELQSAYFYRRAASFIRVIILCKNKSSDWRIVFSLIFAGEMIFSLPFHVARFFRPALLDSFTLSNTDLGDSFAVYGVIAMICYFPGGMLADKFSARHLLSASLLATAAGGLYFAQVPDATGLTLLFGYWGITSILLFWAGMIKATREWGGASNQGRAFGLLDGGRGLVAAAMSSIAVLLFANFISPDSNEVSLEEKMDGIKAVIYFYTATTAVAALFIWRYIPASDNRSTKASSVSQAVFEAISSKKVWLQAFIIICSYCAFKASDNYGLYLVNVLSMDQVSAATFTSLTAYLRPVGAICAGFLADRFTASSVIKWSFLVLTVVYILLALSWPEGVLYKLAIFSLVSSYLAVFALRGVYFALVEECRINSYMTGTAVGFISLIGFTPDVFFSSVTGRILDAHEGIKGFEYYFLFMMAVSLLGLVLAIMLNRINRRAREIKPGQITG